MIDIATDLKNRFDYAVIWFFERCEKMHGLEASLSEKDARAVEILNSLCDSVDVIPPSLIRTTVRPSWHSRPKISNGGLSMAYRWSALDTIPPTPPNWRQR